MYGGKQFYGFGVGDDVVEMAEVRVELNDAGVCFLLVAVMTQAGLGGGVMLDLVQ